MLPMLYDSHGIPLFSFLFDSTFVSTDFLQCFSPEDLFSDLSQKIGMIWLIRFHCSQFSSPSLWKALCMWLILLVIFFVLKKSPSRVHATLGSCNHDWFQPFLLVFVWATIALFIHGLSFYTDYGNKFMSRHPQENSYLNVCYFQATSLSLP